MEQIERSASTAGARAPGERSPSVPAWGTGRQYVCPRTLSRAISAAEFDPHEAILVQLALEQCGPLWNVESGEPWQNQVARFPLRLWLWTLANETGLVECDLDRALGTLQDSRVLHRPDRRSLRLNGDVAAWIHPKTGRPRLAGKLLAYCLEER